MNPDPQVLFLLVLIGSCIAIFLEDLRTRTISVLWPLLITVVGVLGIGLKQKPWINGPLLQNFLYLLITFCCTLFWFGSKKIGLKEALRTKFGLGDIVVSFALTPFFTFPEFLLLFIFSSLWGLSLFGFSVFRSNIPFAGLLGLGAVLILFFRVWSEPSFHLIPS